MFENKIEKKKFEILDYIQSSYFSIDGLADKLNELTNLATLVDVNDCSYTELSNLRQELIKKVMAVNAKMKEIDKAIGSRTTVEGCYKRLIGQYNK